jgi:hypothetical protein
LDVSQELGRRQRRRNGVLREGLKREERGCDYRACG